MMVRTRIQPSLLSATPHPHTAAVQYRSMNERRTGSACCLSRIFICCNAAGRSSDCSDPRGLRSAFGRRPAFAVCTLGPTAPTYSGRCRPIHRRYARIKAPFFPSYRKPALFKASFLMRESCAHSGRNLLISSTNAPSRMLVADQLQPLLRAQSRPFLP
jgi:hypothetical protein